jgi:hypothetical protein
MNAQVIAVLLRCSRPLLCSGDMSDTLLGLVWTYFCRWIWGVVVALEMELVRDLFSGWVVGWILILPSESNRQRNRLPLQV